MSTIVASLILTIGASLAGAGILVQRRALSRYGKQPRPAGVRGYWNCAELFDDKRGIRLYLRGDALFSWGMMAVLAIAGYLAGRD